MAWVARKGKQYYYQSVRDGDTVRKVYLGRGDQARKVDKEVRDRKNERLRGAKESSQFAEKTRLIDHDFHAARQMVQDLLAVELWLRGWYFSSYKWRQSGPPRTTINVAEAPPKPVDFGSKNCNLDTFSTIENEYYDQN